jgi:hypothetical protein
MNTSQAWTTFLQQYAATLGSDEWPGRPAATEDQLLPVEKKLTIQLPPSYRAFLKASNGWTHASRAVPILLPVESIHWFRKKFRDWIDDYQLAERIDIPETEYFNYANSDPALFDRKHLRHTLCISEFGDDAVVLLNPMVIWPDGEWETWFFANWLPGALRFRSFADWFKHEYAEISPAAVFTHSQKPNELPTVYLDPPSQVDRRVRAPKKIHDFASVLKLLKSSDPKKRRTAVKRLARIRTHESFTALSDILRTEKDRYVRMESITSIGQIGTEAAIDYLIDWVTRCEELRSDAVHALAAIPTERATLFVLDLLAKADQCAGGILYDLSQRNELRAIPHAINLMTNPQFQADRERPYWGEWIAEYRSSDAFDALRPFSTHPDYTVRQSVLHGLVMLAHRAKRSHIKREARALVEASLANESEPAVRAAIQPWVDCFPKKSGAEPTS